MFSLISKGIKFSAWTALNALVLSYVSDYLSPNSATLAGVVPSEIVNIIRCTLSTLAWIFTPQAIYFAMAAWFIFPALKLGVYNTYKLKVHL